MAQFVQQLFTFTTPTKCCFYWWLHVPINWGNKARSPKQQPNGTCPKASINRYNNTSGSSFFLNTSCSSGPEIDTKPLREHLHENQKTRKGTAPAKGHTDSGKCSQRIQHKGPDRVDEEQDDADGVWHAIGLFEGRPEATWRVDVLLEQVAPDDQAYKYADGVVPEFVCEEAGGDDREKNQRAWQL